MDEWDAGGWGGLVCVDGGGTSSEQEVVVVEGAGVVMVMSVVPGPQWLHFVTWVVKPGGGVDVCGLHGPWVHVSVTV